MNVIFATPADGSIVLDSPIDNSKLDKGPSYDPDVRSTRVPGTGEERRAGMVVVTHRSNKLDHWQPPTARRVEDGIEVPRWVSARFLGRRRDRGGLALGGRRRRAGDPAALRRRGVIDGT